VELTKDSLEEWRAHPVTAHLRNLFSRECKVLRQSMFEAWLQTGATSEVDRRVLLRCEAIMSDWFDFDAKRLDEVEEWIDEQERHQPR
jgi:uncharacterized phage-associated protein